MALWIPCEGEVHQLFFPEGIGRRPLPLHFPSFP